MDFETLRKAYGAEPEAVFRSESWKDGGHYVPQSIAEAGAFNRLWLAELRLRFFWTGERLNASIMGIKASDFQSRLVAVTPVEFTLRGEGDADVRRERLEFSHRPYSKELRDLLDAVLSDEVTEPPKVTRLLLACDVRSKDVEHKAQRPGQPLKPATLAAMGEPAQGLILDELMRTYGLTLEWRPAREAQTDGSEGNQQPPPPVEGAGDAGGAQAPA